MDENPLRADCADEEIEALVDAVRRDPSRRDELVALLAENAPLHAGRSTAATARIRAWVLAAFEEVGLPDEALPHALGDLETEQEPLLVAAAAKAIRGRPENASFPSLLAALWTMAGRDGPVTFEAMRPSWPARCPTRATRELLRTVDALAPTTSVSRRALEEFRAVRGALLDADTAAQLDFTIAALPPPSPSGCCASARSIDLPNPRLSPPGRHGPAPAGICLQDQNGETIPFADVLADGSTVLAYFYTRCENPRKCSRTISALAELARLLAAAPRTVRVAAVTYDPDYDDPGRLRAYGEVRGVPFGAGMKLYRAVEGHDALRRHLDVAVGYTGSVVNRHAVQLFLLDLAGTIRQTWTRRLWQPTSVARQIGATVL